VMRGVLNASYLQEKAFLPGHAFLLYSCKADHGLRVSLASLQSCYLDHARQALDLLAIVPPCHLASLNVSVYAPWLVTNNDKRHALHVYSKCICTK